MRIFKLDLERRYGRKLTADEVLWTWLIRYTAWASSTFRVRADGKTAHESCYAVKYKGEILPFGETALFKVSASHSKQIAADRLQHKGESTMIKRSVGRKAFRV